MTKDKSKTNYSVGGRLKARKRRPAVTRRHNSHNKAKSTQLVCVECCVTPERPERTSGLSNGSLPEGGGGGAHGGSHVRARHMG